MDFLPQLLQTVILILQNFVVLTNSGWKTWSIEMSSKLLNSNTGKKCVKNTLRSQTGLRLNVMYGEQNFLQAGKSGVLPGVSLLTCKLRILLIGNSKKLSTKKYWYLERSTQSFFYRQ